MAIKKSELYSSIWKSCDELRGGMDASQYKDYVLVLLFVKYVTDKYKDDKGYPPIKVRDGGSFEEMKAAKGKPDIGEQLNIIIKKLAQENNLNNIIDTADFDDKSKLGDGKEMQDRLTNLIAIFEDPALDFSKNRAADDDLLGDAYEYLMRNFATQSGKSKGQFYTPAEVSRVMARIIGIDRAYSNSQTVYDPTCGSGSLLLKAADEAPVDVTIYGQEMDNSTRALAKMNMILHGHPTAQIVRGNTLSNPLFKKGDNQLQTFDFAVANPPFSSKAWSNGLKPENDPYDRFVDGIPPQKNGDYAFLQHFIRSLNSKGKGAIILPHGVLFRGNVEAEIRQRIVRQGYIKGIIGLPSNLFYGTGIPACIIVIDKQNAASRRGIFMIDASQGFTKDGNKNRLRHQDIHKIVDVFNNQIELPRYSRMVSFDEIQTNDYNLNIPRYIDTSEPEDIQDIEAHLHGGIPCRDINALQAYWDVFPSVAQALFADNGRPEYRELRVEPAAIKNTIFEHPEFKQYAAQVNAVFTEWAQGNTPRLKGIKQNDKPADLINAIAGDLLACFARVPLIDKYDIYQHLMTYWTDVMQDDVYSLMAEGWGVANVLRVLVKQNKKYVEDHDFELNRKRYKADLIPPELVIRRYFSAEQAAIDELEAEQEAVTAAMQELEEEHSGEDGLLAEATSDAGNVTKTAIKNRMKAIEGDDDEAEEYAVLSQYQQLTDRESDLKSAIKDAQAALYAAVIEKYPTLSEADAKALLVGDKWLAAIEAGVHSELDRISQALTARVKQLAERYATPLPEIERRAQQHSQRVAQHLSRMGYDV